MSMNLNEESGLFTVYHGSRDAQRGVLRRPASPLTDIEAESGESKIHPSHPEETACLRRMVYCNRSRRSNS